MSQESRSNQKISSPLARSTSINNPVDAYADRLIDELFADIDQILEGGSKLSGRSGKPETIDAVTVPQIALPPGTIDSEEEVVSFPIGYSSLQPHSEPTFALNTPQVEPDSALGADNLHLDYPATAPSVAKESHGQEEELTPEQLPLAQEVKEQKTVLQTDQKTVLQEAAALPQSPPQPTPQVEPEEPPRQPERPIGSQVRGKVPQASPPTSQRTPQAVEKFRPPASAPQSDRLADKLLTWGTLAALVSAAILFISWLIAQYALNAQPGQQTAASSTPPTSTADAQMIDYMLRSLKTIDRQASEPTPSPSNATPLPPSTTLPPVRYNPDSPPAKAPAPIRERVYIPIYPPNSQTPAKAPRRPNSR
ncbi:MAG: hypothetical protein KME17_12030 [Cyanosarcina radialis HA8281-LM2]|jgi:hypothetical protein|nr:hypothetical protein [Cyanosarcina radialis HA8281-LM2]